MGVNMVGFCISDDEVCCEASKNEIIRRYYAATNKLAAGECNEEEISKIQLLFKQAKITTDYRKVTVAAKDHKNETGHTSSAIELEDGTIICGHSSEQPEPYARLAAVRGDDGCKRHERHEQRNHRRTD